jgi:hypothetical protein
MIGQVTAAMALLRTTAAGAAVATAFATGGVSAIAGAVAVAGILAAVGLTAPGTTAGGSGKGGATGGNPLPKLGAGGATGGTSATSRNYTGHPSMNSIGAVASADQTFAAWLAALNNNTKATVKNTKSVMDIATENAMKELAARQKALSGSASIAIGGGGKIYSTRNDAGKIDVNVYAGNVVGSADALIQVVQQGLQATGRRNGGGLGLAAPMQVV